MEFEFNWASPTLLICKVTGTSTVADCENLMRSAVSRPEFRPGIDVIVDHTSVDVSALTAADIERIADLHAQFAVSPPVRAAIVAGQDSPTRYGLARMFESYADSQANAEIRVFETLDEAMAWLRPPD